MKADLKKQIPSYGARRHRFDIVAVPPLQYLMIDGRGDPNTAPAYAAAVSTLFPVAYRIKFMSRSDLDRDYTVMPLEAQWWADDMTAFTTARDKSQWNLDGSEPRAGVDHAGARDRCVRAGVGPGPRSRPR